MKCKLIENERKHVVIVFLCLFLFGLCETNSRDIAPRIKEHPADTVTGRSEPATLRCLVEGRPKPTVQWYKDGVLLTSAEDGHRVPLEDGLLFLRVRVGKKESDEGVYWCVARNQAGEAISRNASLTLAVIRSEFRSEPRDISVSAGEPVELECSPPKGAPQPVVRWLRDGLRYDVEPGGRVTITEGGNLKFLQTVTSDSGVYRCVAWNIAGERQSRGAALLVLTQPQLLLQPNNASVLVGQSVEFSCQSGHSTSVSWSKEGSPLPTHAVVSGSLLRLRRVTAADAGRYICSAGSQRAYAQLIVQSLPYFTETPSNLTVKEGDTVSIPCAAEGLPTPTTFFIIDGNHYSLLFSQCSPNNSNSLHLQKVTVEHSGRIVCAAVNDAGSIMHEAYLNVLRKEDNEMREPTDGNLLVDKEVKITNYELRQARKYLKQNILDLKRIETLSSTSLKIVWDVLTDYNEYLEGIKLWYNGTSMNSRNLTHEDVSNFNYTSCDGALIKIDNSGSSSYVLSGLMPYTQYEIILVPFYKNILGKPSNLMSGYTDDDVPSVPPRGVSVTVINTTAAWIRWEPPSAYTWNGELTGYVLEIVAGDGPSGRVVGQMSLNASTRAATASSLRPQQMYSVRAAAITKRGRGPFSAEQHILMPALMTHTQRGLSSSDDVSAPRTPQETWLLALSAVLLSILAVGSLTIYCVRRRNALQKKKPTGDSMLTSSCLLNKDTMWLRESALCAHTGSVHHALLTGQSTSERSVSMDPEYSIPLSSVPALDNHYAPTSPIYTELNFKDCDDSGENRTRRSRNNSMVRSCNGSSQCWGECSTCGRSTSSRSTSSCRDPRQCDNDIDSVEENCRTCHNRRPSEDNCGSCHVNRRPLEDNCGSCHNNRRPSSSRDKASDSDYDYPQWPQCLPKNSGCKRRTKERNHHHRCHIKLTDILPPPPYESPENKA